MDEDFESDIEDEVFDDLHGFDTEPVQEIMQEEYDDAVIEDTTHCDLCDRVLRCGDNDCLISESGWAICVQCAEEAAQLYEQALQDAGVCEHGVNDGDYCAACNRAYKAAAADPANGISPEEGSGEQPQENG